MAVERTVQKVPFHSYLDYLALRRVDSTPGLPQSIAVNVLESRGVTPDNLLATIIGFNRDDLRQLGRVDRNPSGGPSIVENVYKLVNAVDIMLPRVDEPPREIRLLENGRDVKDYEYARQMERVQNLGINVQKRLMFLFSVIGKPEFAQVFSQGHMTLPGFINSQFEIIQQLINEYHTEYGSHMDLGKLAEDFANQLKPCIDLFSKRGNADLEKTGFEGIAGIMSNDLHRELGLGFVLHQATQGVVPAHLERVAQKDATGLNPYETKLLTLLTEVDPVAMAYYLVTGSTDILPNEPAFPRIPDDITELNKRAVFKTPLSKSLAEFVLRLGSAIRPYRHGRELAYGVFRAIDSAKEHATKMPANLMARELRSLFFISPKSVTILAQMIRASGVESKGAANYLKELDKWIIGDPNATTYMGDTSDKARRLGLTNKDGDIAKWLETAFATGIYGVGGRVTDMSGVVPAIKEFWNFKTPRNDRSGRWIFAHPLYYKHPGVDKRLAELERAKKQVTDGRLKHAIPTTNNAEAKERAASADEQQEMKKRLDRSILKTVQSPETFANLQMVYDQVTSTTVDMFNNNIEAFPAQLILNTVVLAEHEGEEQFDTAKNSSREALARNLVRWYVYVSEQLSLPDCDKTRLISYRTALATALKIVSHTWRPTDLETIQKHLFDTLGAGFIEKHPELAWEIMGQLLGDEAVTLPLYSSHFGEVKKQIDAIAGSFLKVWDNYTVGMDKNRKGPVRVVDVLYDVDNGVKDENAFVVVPAMRAFFKEMWALAGKFPIVEEREGKVVSNSLRPHIKTLFDRASEELVAERASLEPQIQRVNADVSSILGEIKEKAAPQSLPDGMFENISKLMDAGTAQGGFGGTAVQAAFINSTDALERMITALDGGARATLALAQNTDIQASIEHLRSITAQMKPLKMQLTRIQTRSEKLRPQLGKFFSETEIAAALPTKEKTQETD